MFRKPNSKESVDNAIEEIVEKLHSIVEPHNCRDRSRWSVELN